MKEWGNISDEEKSIISWALVGALSRLKSIGDKDVYPRWLIKKCKKEHDDLMEKLECYHIIRKKIGKKGFYVEAKSGIGMWIDIESLHKKEQNELINKFVKDWCQY